jgi:hypothetical protein
MGEPAAVLTVNGTKRQSQAPAPLPGETRMSPEQFWTERLQALKRHIESTQTGSSDTGPSGGRPDAEDGR